MCRKPGQQLKEQRSDGSSSMFLFSKESFSEECFNNTSKKSDDNKVPPSTTNRNMALFVTGSIIVGLLVVVEMTLRQVFTYYQDFHPIFHNETNRNILARHVGVDAFSCFVVAYLGWKARHLMQDIVDSTFLGSNKTDDNKNKKMGTYEDRMFKYQPEAARICLFFFAYQVKNTYDTIVWNDGPEFIAHHVLTLGTCWTPMVFGGAHAYVPFYFGVSEISTAVLCLLANFDDVHGVPGLADAFPMMKVILGGLFAVLFIVCRVFSWSTVSYFYCKDAWNALNNGSEAQLMNRKNWFRYTFVSLSLLSLLQIIWLAEIARVGKEELEKVGLNDDDEEDVEDDSDDDKRIIDWVRPTSTRSYVDTF
eukprot:CAMPEP_0113497674 /NCGR_PEP_ID=MMETSP0014_2-20120614/30754_1 /TAXON_ID=2857 /ORGANISM="Nitzschia sp." /LENGTH=363 /DNA_ID=CAMNT_0000391625 /DNA_START=219 /DNA_END=1311 /DNA_ORIENTATION=+ /assembly_acc=CAM_ASM_000159